MNLDYDYPVNFVKSIGLEPTEDIVSNFDRRYERLLERKPGLLTTTEKDVLGFRYRHGKSFQEIAKGIDLSTARVRDIVATAIRKIRGNVIFLASDSEYLDAKADVSSKIRILKAKAALLSDVIAKCNAALKLIGDSLSHEETKEDTLIECMDMSVRTTNAIRRGGYKTADDIFGAGPDAIKRIRNMGKKSFRELKEKLLDMGYDAHDW